MKLRPVKQSVLLRDFLALEHRDASSGLNPAERERWRALRRQIEVRLRVRSAPPGREQRRSIRIPLALDVAFTTTGECTRAKLNNFSRGGFLIETKEPLPVGTVFEASIAVEEWRLALTAPVQVVSVRDGEGDDAAGMGVAFQGLGESEQRKVNAIYDLCLGAALEGARGS